MGPYVASTFDALFARDDHLIKRSIAEAAIKLLESFNIEYKLAMIERLMPLYVVDDQRMRVMMAQNIVAVQIAAGQEFTKDRLVDIVRNLMVDHDANVVNAIKAEMDEFVKLLNLESALYLFRLRQ